MAHSARNLNSWCLRRFCPTRQSQPLRHKMSCGEHYSSDKDQHDGSDEACPYHSDFWKDFAHTLEEDEDGEEDEEIRANISDILKMMGHVENEKTASEVTFRKSGGLEQGAPEEAYEQEEEEEDEAAIGLSLNPYEMPDTEDMPADSDEAFSLGDCK
mmetsp:Transcript_94228/g.166254  ORF Transcript_94228/g.166254 Transcript_94228/m.166254 type:complete len:157 (+) Transcript_94228:84-554(+)